MTERGERRRDVARKSAKEISTAFFSEWVNGWASVLISLFPVSVTAPPFPALPSCPKKGGVRGNRGQCGREICFVS